jgi:uncharacterized Fe-S cluster protein YjdI/CDGSH-type Zn-finger protein
MTSVRSSEERYQPTVQRVYEGEGIEVTWEPSLCIHFAACIRGSLAAFNPRRRPWIDVTAEPAEKLAEIASRCPTGALHARWVDGHAAESPPEPMTVLPMLDGPLFLHGRIKIRDRQGNLVREDVRMALCRCGHSQNKPFCDNSHEQFGFHSEDPGFGEEPDDPDDLVR